MPVYLSRDSSRIASSELNETDDTLAVSFLPKMPVYLSRDSSRIASSALNDVDDTEIEKSSFSYHPPIAYLILTNCHFSPFQNLIWPLVVSYASSPIVEPSAGRSLNSEIIIGNTVSSVIYFPVTSLYWNVVLG